MLVGAEDGGSSISGSLAHGLTKLLGLVERVEVSLEELGDDVASEVSMCFFTSRCDLFSVFSRHLLALCLLSLIYFKSLHKLKLK